MARLSVAQLNMPTTVESCKAQIIALHIASRVASEHNSFNYSEMLFELIQLIFAHYQSLGGTAEQIGDITPWGTIQAIKRLEELTSEV
jgi:hypothetical protein